MSARDLTPSARIVRWLMVLAAGAVAATLVGFVLATRRAPQLAGYHPARTPDAQAFEPAPTYAKLAEGRQSPNRTRHPATLAALTAKASPVQSAKHDEQAWQAARTSRAQRRAYDGAPPVIPHPIDPRALPNCQACHEHGLQIADKRAASMSHEAHASCTQCHVVDIASQPHRPGLADQPPLDNAFVGLESAGKGVRAWPGAPPLIPHATHMRERCQSCHGTLSPGLHSSHVERQSCLQCHGSSAQLEQRALGALVSRRTEQAP